jgi:deoxyribonuclease-4
MDLDVHSCDRHNLDIRDVSSVLNNPSSLLTIPTVSSTADIHQHPREIVFIERNHRVGTSCPIFGSLTQTLLHQEFDGLRCVQFTISSLHKGTHKFDSTDLEYAKNVCNNYDMSFYIHSPVNLNLSKPPTFKKIGWHKKILAQELVQVCDMPAGCVLHIGKAKDGGTLTNLCNNIESIGLIRDNNVPSLILENAAGQGTDLGVTIDEIRHIYEKLDYNVIGLCIDTQHSFASGICDFRVPDKVNEFMDEIESIISHPIDLIHLNDSKKEFGSRVDRHETLCRGYIWQADRSGLYTLINRCFDQSINMITETPTPLEDARMIVEQYI